MARRISFVVLIILVGLLNALPGYAQSSATRSTFEVATIKPNNGNGSSRLIQIAPGGRLHVENLPLKVLIQFAYDVRDFQISDGPSWIGSVGYDVAAKAEGNQTIEQMRPMLRSLLADRFGLRLHRETKEMPVYNLTPAKGGIKFAPSIEGVCVQPDAKSVPPPPRPGGTPPNYCGDFHNRSGLIDALGIPMQSLVMELSDVVGRTVIDKTGFTETFDVHLEYAPDDEPSDSARPSIFTALQEQMGLRLESSKGPVEMLVIDHVERPSDN